MSTLAELVRAETAADDARRAVGRVPGVLREPGSAEAAYARWEAAHQALMEGRRDAELEAG